MTDTSETEDLARIEQLSLGALRSLVHEHLGAVPGYNVTRRQLHSALWYKTNVRGNPVDELRAQIIDFIEHTRDRLSLPCDGNCYAHSDARVLQCARELNRDQGVAALEDETA